jgi:hypothetical protein
MVLPFVNAGHFSVTQSEQVALIGGAEFQAGNTKPAKVT